MQSASSRGGSNKALAILGQNDLEPRIKLLVLKINISSLIQNVTIMREAHQVGSCRTLITKGLDVIRRSGIKDNWLMDKSDVLTNMLHDLENQVREKSKEEVERVNEKSETDAELDEIFGDKKKW